MVSAHFDLHRIPERCEADQFDHGTNENAHFEEAGAVFGRGSYFDHRAPSSRCQGRERLWRVHKFWREVDIVQIPRVQVSFEIFCDFPPLGNKRGSESGSVW